MSNRPIPELEGHSIPSPIQKYIDDLLAKNQSLEVHNSELLSGGNPQRFQLITNLREKNTDLAKEAVSFREETIRLNQEIESLNSNLQSLQAWYAEKYKEQEEKNTDLEKEVVSFREEAIRLKQEIENQTNDLARKTPDSQLQSLQAWYAQKYKEQVTELESSLRNEFKEEYLSEHKIRVETQRVLKKVKDGLSEREDSIARQEQELIKRKQRFDGEIDEAAEIIATKKVSEKYRALKKATNDHLQWQGMQKAALKKQWREVEKENDDQRQQRQREKKELTDARKAMQLQIERGEKKVQKKVESLDVRLEKMKAKYPSQRGLHMRVKALNSENTDLKDNLLKAERKLERQKSQLEKQKAEHSRADDNNSVFSISSEKIFDWFVEGRSKRRSFFPSDLITIGTGPLDGGWFDDRLREHGFTPCSNNKDCTHIVVGREDWETSLDEVVERDSEEGCYVYSQELFIAAYCLDDDLFDLGEIDLLFEFSKGHPALEYLISNGFEWPEILEPLPDEPEKLDSVDWNDSSPLTDAGYHAGKTKNLRDTTRREILEAVIKADIPWMHSDEYMQEWGTPGTRRRIWRVAHHIAWLIRFRKNNPTQIHAIHDWENDFWWLKKNFYRRSMKFRWPYI